VEQRGVDPDGGCDFGDVGGFVVGFLEGGEEGCVAVGTTGPGV